MSKRESKRTKSVPTTSRRSFSEDNASDDTIKDEDLVPTKIYITTANNCEGIKRINLAPLIDESSKKFSAVDEKCKSWLNDHRICTQILRMKDDSIVKLYLMRQSSPDKFIRRLERLLADVNAVPFTIANVRYSSDSKTDYGMIIDKVIELNMVAQSTFIDTIIQAQIQTKLQTLAPIPVHPDPHSPVGQDAARRELDTRMRPDFDDDVLPVSAKIQFRKFLEYRAKNMKRAYFRDSKKYMDYLNPSIPQNARNPLTEIDLTKLAYEVTQNGMPSLKDELEEVVDVDILTRENFIDQSEEMLSSGNKPEWSAICEAILKGETTTGEIFGKRLFGIERNVKNDFDIQNIARVDGHAHSNASIDHAIIVKVLREQVNRNEEIVENDPAPINFSQLLQQEHIDHNNISTSSIGMFCGARATNNFTYFNKSKLFNRPRVHTAVFTKSGPLSGLIYARMLKLQLKEWRRGKQRSELRFSLKGDKRDEIIKLAQFFASHNLFSEYGDVLKIFLQFSRRTDTLFSSGNVSNFHSVLENLFTVIVEASLNEHLYPEVSDFLEHCSGVDVVDMESANSDGSFKFRVPRQMNSTRLPVDYQTLLFYFHVHITLLNLVRNARKLNVLEMVPHGLEISKPENAIPLFLLSQRFCHGLTIHENPQLHYLMLLAEQEFLLAPSSNSILFGVPIADSPIKKYQYQGMRLTISSDDYNMLALGGNNSLYRELDMLAVEAKMELADLFELSLRSVTMSSFQNVYTEAQIRNEEFTGVPNVRSLFRQRQLKSLLDNLFRNS